MTGPAASSSPSPTSLNRTRVPVSVCIISGAEAGRIGRALASVSSWAAEVNVVLNEEVTDGTEEICRQHGAHVFREPWRGYVAQVNSAATKASQPWILGLDADEAITPGLEAEICAVVNTESDASQPVAFSMPRLSFYAGRWIRHGDWYPDRKIRLWRRGQGAWEGEDPHYHVVVQGAVGRFRGDIQHFSFESLKHHVAKLQVYSDIFARDARKTGRSPSLLDLAIRPPWRFLRGYFFRLGFLDGWQGFVIAWMSALLAFLKYAKLREACLKEK
ncbi:MAG TPA: glycosyltransferase family 2 protein [Candidatus Limnocylindria bacterium]|jgi:glycosyltransferase involved in cell wall biosynthesis|nr:glycosyltransferase family 2 protein [Candidatus Limnocylindria bacterium]